MCYEMKKSEIATHVLRTEKERNNDIHINDGKRGYGQNKLTESSIGKLVSVCVKSLSFEHSREQLQTEANIKFNPRSHIFNPSLSTFFLFFYFIQPFLTTRLIRLVKRIFYRSITI